MICFDREFPEAARAARAGRRRDRPGAQRLPAAGRPGGAGPHPRLREHGRASRWPTTPRRSGRGGRRPRGLRRPLARLQRHLLRTRRRAARPDARGGRSRRGDRAGDVRPRRLRDYRAREVWGDAYRRPGAYGLLVDGPVAPVFARADARREVVRAPSVCDACGASFGCGAGTGSCWCVEETVPAERARRVARHYDGCLCPDCLRDVAAGASLTPPVRGRSAAPPAASSPSAG